MHESGANSIFEVTYYPHVVRIRLTKHDLVDMVDVCSNDGLRLEEVVDGQFDARV